MSGLRVHNAAGPLALVSVCLCVTACGVASNGLGSRHHASSNPPSSSGAAAVSTSGLALTRSHIYGDYDGDDLGMHGSDGDNDDNSNPKDRDNDSDNNSGSYYDKDDSVREFGHAADVADRQAVAAVVERYFAAAASEDGATACSLIVSSLARSIPGDLGRPPGPPYARGRTCAIVMSKIFKVNHRQLRVYHAMLEVTGVRLGGDGGFAVLGFGTLPGREIRVTREKSVWKMDALLDSELP